MLNQRDISRIYLDYLSNFKKFPDIPDLDFSRKSFAVTLDKSKRVKVLNILVHLDQIGTCHRLCKFNNLQYFWDE